MIPRIIELTETEVGTFYLLDTNTVCISFEYNLIDVEIQSGLDLRSKFDSLFKSIAEEITIKMSSVYTKKKQSDGFFSRNQQVAKVGYSEFKNYIHFEMKLSGFLNQTTTLISSIMRKTQTSITDNLILSFCDKVNINQFKNVLTDLKPVNVETIYSFYPDYKLPIQLCDQSALMKMSILG